MVAEFTYFSLLPEVDKYLGVCPQEDLNMYQHQNNGYRMAYQKIFKLKKIRKQLSAETALLVYTQTIIPYF